MTDSIPLWDSRKRSRMLALFLIAMAAGFILHWAGYRLISSDREELSGFKLPRRRFLSKAGWNAYVERKRRLEENGGSNDLGIEQLMNEYIPGGKGRKEEADVLVPEVVHWKSYRRQIRLGNENRTRGRPQFNNPKERRGRIREHLEMERRRRFGIKSDEEHVKQKQEEEVQETTKAPVKDKEEEDAESKTTPSLSADSKQVEEAITREAIVPTEGMRWIRSTFLPTFSNSKLSEAPGPAGPPASLDGGEGIESTSKVSTTLPSAGEDVPSRLTLDTQNTKSTSERPKSSGEIEVETSSFSPEATRDSNSSDANSTSEIRLLSKPTFSWLMSNESICKLDGNKNNTRLLAILVLSTRQGYGSRQAIRHSWGSVNKYANWQIRVVFLLGAAPSTQGEEEEMLSKQLQKEQDKHGDLIMGNFKDTPLNITLKHLMGLKWILEFCENASFVMKVDDNIFLNTMAFVDARNKELQQASSSQLGFPRPTDLYCRLRKNVKPDEDPAVYEKLLETMYPDFCHRWAYGASLPAIQKLYSVSSKVDMKLKIWTDDVFVTGILKKAAFRQYNWLPTISIITDYTSLDSVEAGYGQQMALIRDLCKNGEWDKNWPVNAVTYLKKEEDDQGKLLERDMRCVWSKVLYDRKGSYEKKSRNV